MPYVLGIEIGSGSTVVAASYLRHGTWSGPEVSLVVPSALRLTADGPMGGVAGTGPDVVYGFLDRVGDDVPLVVAGRPYGAAALTAELVAWVVGQIEDVEEAPAEQVVLSVPGTWGEHRTGVLHAALDRAGLDRVRSLPAPIAAVEGYAAHEPVDPGDTVAVYALGGTRCACSLVRRTSVAAFDLVAHAETGVPIGGGDFDDVLVEFVVGRLGSDPALRERCTAAREELSGATVTTVRAPASQDAVTISRAEFEELIEPLVDSTVDTLLRVIGSGPAPAAVLLVGGAARTPLVRRRVEAAVAGPVRMAHDPAHSVALGAAGAARTPEDRGDAVAAYRPPGAQDSGGMRADGEDVSDAYPQVSYPPPRPPVRITALEAPRRRSARRAARDLAPGARVALVVLAVLVVVVGVWLTLAVGLGRT